MRFPSYARSSTLAEGTTLDVDGVQESVHLINTLDAPLQVSDELAETPVRYEPFERELEDTKAALEALRKEHQDTKSLLHSRSDELRAAKAFIITTDKISTSDVQRAVQRLNAEIFQLAASVADEWGYRTHYFPKDPEREAAEIASAKSLKGVVGPRLVGLLRTIRHDKGSLCVQLALQSVLAAYSKELSQRWSIGDKEDQENYLRTVVYERLKESESLSVSRMWRAFASRFSKEPGSSMSHAKTAVAEHLASVLLVAGVEWEGEDAIATLLEKFSNGIESLLQQIAGLQEMFHESIVSCELQLAVIHPDGHFHELQAEDIGNASADTAGREVICTTDVGLRRIEERDDAVRATAILRPKVYTETIIHDLIQIGVKAGRPPRRAYDSKHAHSSHGRGLHRPRQGTCRKV